VSDVFVNKTGEMVMPLEVFKQLDYAKVIKSVYRADYPKRKKPRKRGR
jgi:hypothetical protein